MCSAVAGSSGSPESVRKLAAQPAGSSLPGLTFQPAEFAKLGLVLFMAHSLARKKDKVKSFRGGFLSYMLILAVLIGLLLAQPDLGSALTLSLVAVAMLMVAGSRLRYLGSAGLIALPFLYFMVMNVDYRRRRIMASLTPGKIRATQASRLSKAGLPSVPAVPSVKGLGESKQKLFYLPEAHTDFIFSVIGEELGFIGVIVIASMFMLLVLRGTAHGTQCSERIQLLSGFRSHFSNWYAGICQYGRGSGDGTPPKGWRYRFFPMEERVW